MADEFILSGNLTFQCLKCRHETEKTVAWLQENPRFPCAGCGATFDLDKEWLSRIAETLAQAIDGMGKTSKKFGES